MKIDKTNGHEPKYIVGVYYGLISDHYYFGAYVDANHFFKKLVAKFETESDEPHSVSMYDIKRDIRKAFWKN